MKPPGGGRLSRRKLMLVACAAALVWPGCQRSTPREQPEVVVYTALDREFSEPVLEQFTRQTGIRVRAVYDTESTKTVALANRIRAEARRPRCDVFWNNEILNTIQLKREGLLEAYASPAAADFPPQFRDPEGYWYGLAARARVLIVNTELVPPEQRPRSIFELTQPRWRGRVGIAKPLFGTTASHVAALFAVLGEQRARRFFDALAANEVRVLSGNKACAELVGAGQLAVALTDTDDALIERDLGRPVQIVFPDQGTDQQGTLVLPNTVAIVKGAPHPQAARVLVDFLLSPQVEQMLARGRSGQIPLSRRCQARSRLGDLSGLKAMEVDFEQAAARFADAARYIERHFLD